MHSRCNYSVVGRAVASSAVRPPGFVWGFSLFPASENLIAIASKPIASLFLVVQPGAPSSVLAPSSDAPTSVLDPSFPKI